MLKRRGTKIFKEVSVTPKIEVVTTPVQPKKVFILDPDEFKDRIQDVKKCNVPDFGYEDVIVFDESPQKRRVSIPTNDKTSKWALFYDAIKKYPKFEKLKNFIEEANKVKDHVDELKKQQQLEEYLQRKLNEKNKSKTSTGKDNQSILLQLNSGGLQKMMDQEMQPRSLTNNEIKIQEIKKNMQDVQDSFLVDSQKFEQLKKLMNYKQPQEGQESQNYHRCQTVSRVDNYWRPEERKRLLDCVSKEGQTFKNKQEQISVKDYQENIHHQKNNQLKSIKRCGSSGEESRVPQSLNYSHQSFSGEIMRSHLNSSICMSIQSPRVQQMERISPLVQSVIVDKLLKYSIDRLVYYEGVLQKQIMGSQNQEKRSKKKMKFMNQRLEALTQCINDLKERKFQLISQTLFSCFNEDEFRELKNEIFKVLTVLQKFYQASDNETSYKNILLKKVVQLYRRFIGEIPEQLKYIQSSSSSKKKVQDKFNRPMTTSISKFHDDMKNTTSFRRLVINSSMESYKDYNTNNTQIKQSPSTSIVENQGQQDDVQIQLVNQRYKQNNNKQQKRIMISQKKSESQHNSAIRVSSIECRAPDLTPMRNGSQDNKVRVSSNITQDSQRGHIGNNQSDIQIQDEIYSNTLKNIQIQITKKKKTKKRFASIDFGAMPMAIVKLKKKNYANMQPIYLTGHSRPVRKVLYNYDGDLLFTCSDDGKVCMYNTYDCARIGVFSINEACKSIDVSKDSKWLVAAATTHGAFIYSTNDGELKAKIEVPGIQAKQTEFALGDKKLLILYDLDRRSYVRIFDFAKALKSEYTKEVCEKEVAGPQDHLITQVSWGPLNKSLYIATDKGRMIIHDLENDKDTESSDVHKSEIFSFTVTYDHTMLITCSRDFTAKLLHPRTLKPIRVFSFGKPCRSAHISPLFDNQDCQKFHVLLAGGQDAKEVTTTTAKEGGFEIKLMSIIYNEDLASITGHFGTVHTVAFSPDGTSFASGSEDGYVHFHKLLPEYFTKRFE